LRQQNCQLSIAAVAAPSSSKCRCRRYLSTRTARPAAGKQDHYQVLGIKRTASAKEIKSAFYSLSKKYHPDANHQGDQAKTTEMFTLVSEYGLDSEIDLDLDS